MKHLLICLSMAVSLMTGYANDATNSPAQLQSYAAGGTPIAIPLPSVDLVEAGNDRGLMELCCPANNRLIACFLSPSDLADLNKGSQSDKVLAKYGMVEVPRRGEYRTCSASDFKVIADGMKRQLGSVIGSALNEAEDVFNRRMKAMDIKDANLSIGKPLLLGRFFSKRDACGYGMVTLVSMFATSAKMGAAIVLTRVKERILFVYLYAEYKNEDTIKWLRTTSEKWADAILEANKDQNK